MQRQSSEKAAEDDADTPAVAINTAGDAAITNGSKPLLFGPTPTASLSTARFDGTTPRDHSLRRSRGGSIEEPPSKARSRRPSPTTATWTGGDAHNGNGFIGKEGGLSKASVISITPVGQAETDKMSSSNPQTRLPTYRSPWSATPLMLFITTLAITFILVIAHSFTWRQLDCKGCRMSYMRPSFARLHDFDTEHTRFASKYSVYLYREQLVDEDTKVKGVPVLFIPGNAGSYKQVRPIAAEAATHFHDVLRHDPAILKAGTRTLDFFTVDFNEEFTAFHGQAILDQAEYLNDAIAYILSLYHDPRRSERDPDLPDPTSVIVLGHSMGGIVARTMLVMPNYQSNSINTIITMAAPHAKPPVSFDAEIINIYKQINDYWRHAYSQKWANNNPLWQVTLLSIAGGSLDTMVPSDYTSLESLVPETHGFTVFTSTVPGVWTGMDHQAILWCDQFRKVVVRALYDVVDVRRAAQTKSRSERMRLFKRWFLTGMEPSAERTLPRKEPTTLLTLEDSSNSILSQGERLVLRGFGQSHKPQAYLIPIPPQGSPVGTQFTLLSDRKLDNPGDYGDLEVLFCSVFPLQPGQSAALFSMNMDLSGDSTGSTRLACKNAASDIITLPASTRESKQPFFLEGEQEIQPYSYLQYDLSDMQEHQFVAVLDKSSSLSPGWAIAEFSDKEQSIRTNRKSLWKLLAFGITTTLPASRPTVMEIKVPALHSSLFAYTLDMESQVCGETDALFTPLLRQYITKPFESKYFVNVKHANINLHGLAPFVPPPLKAGDVDNGMSLEFWTDPTCNSSIVVSLKVDILGSFGKLFMRYRTVLAAFPLLVCALVLQKQFRTYDVTGTFMSFSEGIDACLRRSLLQVMLVLSVLAYFLAASSSAPKSTKSVGVDWRDNSTDPTIDFSKNDLLIGSSDHFFWFLVPFLGIVCVGVCVVLNYAALGLTQLSCMVYTWLHGNLRPSWAQTDEKGRSSSPAFSPSSPKRRFITTAVLLFLVSTFIPYQFAYLVACLVQIATCTRALRLARDTRSASNYNFYNYAHSVLMLMLWTIPAINLPILVVWVHNLSVQWLTPFSSHHNVLSIMPFILLVETLTSGRMVPQVNTRFSWVTSFCFFGIAFYAAVCGVTYAYVLHHLVNLAAAWLVMVQSSTASWTLEGLSSLFEGRKQERKRRKAG